MKNKIIKAIALSLLAVSLISSLLSCANSKQNPHMNVAGAKNLMSDVRRSVDAGMTSDAEFRDAVNSLSFSLAAKLSGDGKQNTLISPLSLIIALALVENGANGQTLAQLEALTGMPVMTLNGYLRGYADSIKDTALKTANSLWLKTGFSPEQSYLQACADYFDAGVYTCDFDSKAVDAINKWVKKNTAGMIDKLLDGISNPDMEMYVVNAVAFEAKWDKEFKKKDTESATFHGTNGDQNVPFMNGEAEAYISFDGAVGISKNYKGDKYAFLALMPTGNGSTADLLTALETMGVNDALSKSNGQAKLSIPSFKYSYDIVGDNLKDAFRALGATDAFDRYAADFSKIGEDLYIDEAIHRCYIEFDESGTKAAAVTGFGFAKNGSAPQYNTVVFDRPFVYVIYDRTTNLPFFIGTVNNL